jgi:hypothetical protein
MDSIARRLAKVKLQGTATSASRGLTDRSRQMPTFRLPLQETSPSSSLVIVATLIALCAIAVWFLVRLNGRGRRDSRREGADSSNRNKVDTTPGEFHDMREALRPLQHSRAVSRRVPRDQE